MKKGKKQGKKGKKRTKNYQEPDKKTIKSKENDTAKAKLNISVSFNSDLVSDNPKDSGYHTRQQSATESIRIQTPLGLQNPGWNCCFMNSTLQLLRSVKELVDYFLIGDAALVYNAKDNIFIAQEFHKLLLAWNINDNLDDAHQKFRAKCGTFDPIWSNGGQQDAAHFLLFLMEKLDQDLKLDNGTSIIQQIFQGRLCQYRRCKKCERSHPIEAVFRTLDLSLVGATAETSVSALLAIFTARTDDGEKSICHTCGINVVTDTKFRILKYPRVLLIALKRYIVENTNGMIIATNIDSQVELDNLKITDILQYNLKAFVSHYGFNPNSGHYKATVHFGGRFVNYSDEHIDVLETAVSSKECYILAYRENVQDASILAEFQWLEERRITLATNLVSQIPSITKGLERLNSSETIRTNSIASIDNPSSIANFSQENKAAGGFEDEDIDYNQFWEDFHHLDAVVCFT